MKLLASFGQNIKRCFFCPENCYDSFNACGYAAYNGSYHVCEYYLQQRMVSEKDRTEAFCLAVKDRQFAMCEMFFKYDDKVCLRYDDIGYFPIHYAAEYGYVEMIKLLLDHGADINAQNDSEGTVLHIATSEGFSDVVTYLVRGGADCEKKHVCGTKPYEDGCFSCFAEMGYPLLPTQEHIHRRFDYLLLEELEGDMTVVLAKQEELPHLFPWIPILRQRMRVGHCFTTENIASDAFTHLSQHEAVEGSQVSDENIRQVVVDCLLALSEGALLSLISNASILAAVKGAFDGNHYSMNEQLLHALDHCADQSLIHHVASGGCDGSHLMPVPFMSLLLQHWSAFTIDVNCSDSVAYSSSQDQVV